MYQEEIVVRYSDSDSEGKCSLISVINYLQDVSTDHSSAIGYSVSNLKHMNVFWAILTWRIELTKIPVYQDHLTIRTFANLLNRCFSVRGFDILDAQGNVIGLAASRWVMCNATTFHVMKILEGMPETYGRDDYMPLEPPKITGREIAELALQEHSRIRVSRRDIDTNGHVNNASYVAYALDALPDDGVDMRTLEVHYRSAAYLGDTLVIKSGWVEDRYAVGLYTPAGELRVLCYFGGARSTDSVVTDKETPSYERI